jgi:hypothetical protein
MKMILLCFALLFGLFTFQVVHYIEFSEQMQRFANKGPRFTAQDGQSLCERVAKLEKEPKPCRYAP